MKLKAKITTLLLLLSVVPLVLTAIIVCHNGQAFLEQSFGSHFQYIARQNLEKVETYIDRIGRDVQEWANLDFMDDVATDDGKRHIVSFLKQLQKEHSFFDGFDVLNAAGEVVASSSPEMYGQKFPEEEFFRKAMTGTAYISDAQWDPHASRGTMVFSSAIRVQHNHEDSMAGVLRARWNLNGLSDILKDSSQKNSSGQAHLLLIRKDGLVIAGTELITRSLLAVNLTEMKLEAARAVQGGKDGYLIEEEPVGGTRYLAGYSTARGYRDLRELGWGMLVVQDVREVFLPVDHFRSIVGVIVLFLVLGVVLMALKVSRGITTPILNIACTAAGVAGGNFDQRINYTSRDELGSLVESFNQMTQDLNRYHSQLMNEKNKLEHLLDIDCTMQSILDINHLVDFVIKHTTALLGARKCSLMLLDHGSGELLIRGAVGLQEEIVKTSRVKLGEPVAGWVARDGNPILVRDIEETGPLARKNGPSYQSRSFMSVPIRVHNKIVGVMNVADKKPEQDDLFTPTDLKVLCTIVRQAAVALENADYYRKLEHLSITDPLTGIFNHRYFIHALDQEIDRAQRYPQPLCLLMLDIDDFKPYNDTYGHPGGDSLLSGISGVLKKNLRKVDIVCRYAGDEFAVILPQTAIPGAQTIADKIRKDIEGSHFERQVTVSIGIAGFNRPMDRRDLIMKADQALYQSKRGGRNKVSCFY
ncbi:MAG: diguanylate cyclase [Candidatus Omnitrophica bacterium]|nr:diguanylate cyclase [Candidatus Omnitrophota bacterium]